MQGEQVVSAYQMNVGISGILFLSFVMLYFACRLLTERSMQTENMKPGLQCWTKRICSHLISWGDNVNVNTVWLLTGIVVIRHFSLAMKIRNMDVQDAFATSQCRLNLVICLVLSLSLSLSDISDNETAYTPLCLIELYDIRNCSWQLSSLYTRIAIRICTQFTDNEEHNSKVFNSCQKHNACLVKVTKMLQ